MAVTRADRELELQQLEAAFKGSDSAILVDYKGLTVPQVSDLRRQIRVAKGRTVETRKMIAQTVFAAAQKHLESVFATSPFVLSVEVQEIDPEFRIHTSNIRDWMKAKQTAA